MKTKEEILSNLPSFYGTEHLYKLSPLFPNFVMTDGVKYLAETAGAYWLVDAIASHFSSYKGKDFVVAKLIKGTGKEWWKLRLEDGNDNVLAQQAIEYSDFPLDKVFIYVVKHVVKQENIRVMMLPSEY